MRASSIGAKARWTAVVLLQAAVLLVPLVMTNVTWLGPNTMSLTINQFQLVQSLALLVIGSASFFAWTLWLALDSGAEVRRSPLDLPIAVLAGWMLLATAFSTDLSTSLFGHYGRFEGLVTFVVYLLVYVLTVQLIDSAHSLRTLLRCLMGSTAIVSAYALIQYVGLDPLRWGGKGTFTDDRVFATLGNPDILGGFLILGLVVGPGLALYESDRKWAAVWWLASGLTYAAWFVSYVRAAWIGGAIAVVAFVVFSLVLRPRFGRSAVVGAFAAGAVALGGAIAALLGKGGVSLAERLTSLTDLGGGSLATRVEIVRAGWRATLASPLIGHGLDSFKYVFPSFVAPEYYRIAGLLPTDHPHSLALQLSVGIGIPGALLALGIVGAGLVNSVKPIVERKASRSALILAAIWAGTLGFFLQSLITVLSPATAFLLWCALGLLMIPLSGGKWSISRTARRALAGAGSVLAILALGIAYGSIAADRAALASLVLPTPEQQMVAVDRATRLAPWQDAYQTMRFEAANRGLSAAVSASGDWDSANPLVAQWFTTTLVSSEGAIDANPADHLNWVDRAALLNNAGRPELARDAAERAVALAPTSPDAKLQLAIAFDALGEERKAEQAAREALEVMPSYLEASLLLAGIYDRAGDSFSARKVLAGARSNLRGNEAAGLLEALAQAETAVGAP